MVIIVCSIFDGKLDFPLLKPKSEFSVSLLHNQLIKKRNSDCSLNRKILDAHDDFMKAVYLQIKTLKSCWK